MTQTKKNNFLSAISEKLIHERKTKDGSRTFYNVSFVCADSESGFASFAVNPEQIFPLTCGDGRVVEGMKKILLGAPEKTRKVWLRKNGGYTHVEMTNADIVRMYTEKHKEYRKMKKAS